MPRPTFFVLGAPKCATTTLYDALLRHPDVCMSAVKEPRFFELGYPGSTEPYERTAFPGYGTESAVGEASPMYLMLPYVTDRLARHYPEAKLVAVLREPLARARSAWWMHFSAGREHLPFAAALRENLRRRALLPVFDGPAGSYLWERNVEAIEERGVMLFRTYLDASLYGEALGRYAERFPADQMLVLFFEDLVRDPASHLARLLDFLGVDGRVALELPRSNPALNPTWAPFVRGLAPLVRRGWVPRPFIEAARRLLKGRSREPEGLPADLAGEVGALFAADLARLAEVFPHLQPPAAWSAGPS